MKLSTASTFSLVVASLIGSVMVDAISAKTRVEPGNMEIHCAFPAFGCPACPDGYHQMGEVHAEFKTCTPDKGAPYYMVYCNMFGTNCASCPDGWHQANKGKYSNSSNWNKLKYCVRD
ncbi:hypothetical protein BDF22DRAFT_667941 [Syncephalis plumigaleata]|nr:hypothetical protein BDF22DRAFT_667941 [Syncephalis plumigaleata]